MTVDKRIRVKKRDSSIVDFDIEKIKSAVFRSAFEVLQDEKEAGFVSGKIANLVLDIIRRRLKKDLSVSVENIQDIVEEALMWSHYTDIARAYILYRNRRAELRLSKTVAGIKDELKLPINTIRVLERRYLLKDNSQKVIETPKELLERVANSISKAELNFKSRSKKSFYEGKFLDALMKLEFLPNSPTLMNAGTKMGQLSACFVLPVGDSIDDIFTALKSMAKIHQTGGGTGFSFSNLRPKNDLVHSTNGLASGPVSFMKIFNAATGVIIQGGRRRGANMGILRCDHPDIIDFIEAKILPKEFENFNLSIAITDKFMDAVRFNRHFELINPRTNKVTRSINARNLFDMIVNAAWHSGDPGLIFIDEVNRHNPTPALGKIEATNPCGELPLLPYESCNLGSINLSKLVKKDGFDWGLLKERVHLGIRFLDNCIEVNKFPLPEIKEITQKNRKVGLGVMGFADMLIALNIPYNSNKAVILAEKIMKFIRQESLRASVELAKERGSFANFKNSIYPKKGFSKLRNATVNTIAPTGTISIISGSSSGIEPIFAISFVRNVMDGTRLIEYNPLFEKVARSNNFFRSEILMKIAEHGSLKEIPSIPDKVKKIFVTSFDIKPMDHLRIQAAFQKYTDNSVSKTINLPKEATVEDVRRIYLRAHELGCKGITVYRYLTRKDQVLSFSDTLPKDYFVKAASEYSGGCASGVCNF